MLMCRLHLFTKGENPFALVAFLLMFSDTRSKATYKRKCLFERLTISEGESMAILMGSMAEGMAESLHLDPQAQSGES